eukprot:scaffold5366_cov154-Chaetoceros_neogracile.AAC.7
MSTCTLSVEGTLSNGSTTSIYADLQPDAQCHHCSTARYKAGKFIVSYDLDANAKLEVYDRIENKEIATWYE